MFQVQSIHPDATNKLRNVQNVLPSSTKKRETLILTLFQELSRASPAILQ